MNKEMHCLTEALGTVISGKEGIIGRMLTALFAGGHILLDDVPGVGKTTLALAMGRVMDLRFGRIQFTPDVLPSDIVGYSVYNKDTGDFEYKAGAVHGVNLLLGDEINRTSSKTQAAFLEAMEEKQITVDGTTYALADPFTVIATQNHVGTAGTQLLPYAQIDRFMVCLSIGYPDHAAQMELLERRQNSNPLDALSALLTIERAREIRAEVQAVTAKRQILEYLSALVIATRAHELCSVGVSPRGMLHLDKMAKAFAYMEGRDYVIPEDVQAVFEDVCAHRIIVTPKARMSGTTAKDVLRDVLAATPVPDWK